MLAGEPDHGAFCRAFAERLRARIMPQREHILIFGAPATWLDALAALFEEQQMRRLVRSVYALDHQAFVAQHGDWRARIPAGITVQPLGAATMEHVSFLEGLWGTTARFLQHGVGYCVLQGDTFLSSCQSVFLGNGCVEVGVATPEANRRKGYARLAACALLERCLALGLEPEWGCLYNPASGALAESLGFTPRPDLPFLYIHGTQEPAPDKAA